MAKWNATNTGAKIVSFSNDPTVKKLVRMSRIKFALIILIVVSIMGALAKPCYSWFRNHQIEKNLEEARSAVRMKDWATARDRAKSVLIARPGDLDAYRIWFTALTHADEPRTYMAAMGLFVNPAATSVDRANSLRTLSVQAPDTLAIAAFMSLSDEEKASTAIRSAYAPLLIHRRQFQVAEKMMRGAPDLNSDPAARLELLKILCATPSPERINEARKIFADLIAEKHDEQALVAMVALSEVDGGLNAGEPLPSLIEWIDSVPKTDTLHQLLALEPGLKSSPLNSANVIDRAIERFIGVDPGILGTWLLRNNYAEKAVQALAEPAKSSPSAYIAYIHALMKVGKLEEAKKIVSTPLKSVDLVHLELVKATVFRAMNDTGSEGRAWNEALAKAAYDQSRNRYIEIARLATVANQPEIVEEAWVAALQVGWGKIPISQDLTPIMVSLARKNRTNDLISMIRTFLRFEPGNPELLNNFNYLTLLEGVLPPTEATKAFEDLIRRFPNAIEVRSGLAMALLMAGQPKLALEEAPKFASSPRISPDFTKALRGTAHLLLGEEETAKLLIEQINWKGLSLSEANVFTRLISKSKIKDVVIPQAQVKAAVEDPSQTPAWKSALEKLEKQRSRDVLPALPTPKLPPPPAIDLGRESEK
jgi:tetratricopeptide (TPR) repeat protein